MMWYAWLCTHRQCLKHLSICISDLPRHRLLVIAALPASLSAWSFSLTLACPEQYILKSLQRNTGYRNHAFYNIYIWYLVFIVMICVCQSNWTPMMIAASAGHTQIVKMLIGHGAQVNAVNCNGQCSLHYAASRGRFEVWIIRFCFGASSYDLLLCWLLLLLITFI